MNKKLLLSLAAIIAIPAQGMHSKQVALSWAKDNKELVYGLGGATIATAALASIYLYQTGKFGSTATTVRNAVFNWDNCKTVLAGATIGGFSGLITKGLPREVGAISCLGTCAFTAHNSNNPTLTLAAVAGFGLMHLIPIRK
jgi:hypothetical protein